MNVTISHTTRSYPSLRYQDMKDDILGKQYALTLTFIGTRRAQMLNERYRNATYIPNVLSFPLDKRMGEIYITPYMVKREAPKWTMTPDCYTGYLFIHGLLHLKGYHHGDTMEKAEKRYILKYKLS